MNKNDMKTCHEKKRWREPRALYCFLLFSHYMHLISGTAMLVRTRAFVSPPSCIIIDYPELSLTFSPLKFFMIVDDSFSVLTMRFGR